MIELYEFRISEEDAALYLGKDIGHSLGGMVRKITVTPSDTLFERIKEVSKLFDMRKEHFFSSWCVRRKYTKKELEQASAFTFDCKRFIKTYGEEGGTRYGGPVCSYCGAGEQQQSDLILLPRMLPKPSLPLIAKTIAGEIIISDRVADIFRAQKLTGIKLGVVRNSKDPAAVIPGWHQLIAVSTVDIASRTQTGTDCFDEDINNEFRCPLSHTLGLAVLSEVWITKCNFREVDIVRSRQCIGIRMGVLRPEPIIIVSPRVREILLANKVSGIYYEIAHVEHEYDT